MHKGASYDGADVGVTVVSATTKLVFRGEPKFSLFHLPLVMVVCCCGSVLPGLPEYEYGHGVLCFQRCCELFTEKDRLWPP